jgi:hypothetical protein
MEDLNDHDELRHDPVLAVLASGPWRSSTNPNGSVEPP